MVSMQLGQKNYVLNVCSSRSNWLIHFHFVPVKSMFLYSIEDLKLGKHWTRLFIFSSLSHLSLACLLVSFWVAIFVLIEVRFSQYEYAWIIFSVQSRIYRPVTWGILFWLPGLKFRSLVAKDLWICFAKSIWWYVLVACLRLLPIFIIISISLLAWWYFVNAELFFVHVKLANMFVSN